jgi:preprotein translocase subunit SecB
MRHTEKERCWQVVLDLKTPPVEESANPYQLEIQVVGFFEVAADFPAENMEKLVGITGSSLLYSAAREFILTITSRGPWPAIFLPTITYQGQPDTGLHEEKSEAPKKKASAKKSKRSKTES